MDNAHFDSEGYRKLGRRYGVQMLFLMGYETTYCESECGTVGENWRIMADENSSNGNYTHPAPGIINLPDPPADDLSVVKMNFAISKDTSYYIYGRFNNPGTNENSYWIKIDGKEYELVENLTTTGWQWLELRRYELSSGEHSISIAFGEEGGSLDKIAIKNSHISPVDRGEEANNICDPEIYIAGFEKIQKKVGYCLEQNYPNPFTGNTSISFEIPSTTFVSLKVSDIEGKEVAELAGKEYPSGICVFLPGRK